jgi:DNA-binding GntR family transcriptional regulator
MPAADNLSQHAYQVLKRSILDGAYTADDVLSERVLAGVCGVSRSPLRAAISRLVNEGAITRLANGALVIRPVTVIQLLEIVQTRRMLEGLAAERAAELGPAPSLLQSQETMRMLIDRTDVPFDSFWDSDRAFHHAVANSAQFRLLPGILDELRTAARRCTIVRTRDSFVQQAKEHLAVIERIEAGDLPGARKAMENHFDNTRTRFLEWVARS